VTFTLALVKNKKHAISQTSYVSAGSWR